MRHFGIGSAVGLLPGAQKLVLQNFPQLPQDVELPSPWSHMAISWRLFLKKKKKNSPPPAVCGAEGEAGFRAGRRWGWVQEMNVQCD